MNCSLSNPARTPSIVRRAAAFTLVELLVVIGIIALLISILLPALNRARESANVATCMANMRGIGQAIDLYVANHKGVMPLITERWYLLSNAQGAPYGLTPASEGYDTVDVGAGRTWAGLLRDFCKVPVQVFRCPSDQRFHKPAPQGFILGGAIDDPKYMFSYSAPLVGVTAGPTSAIGVRHLPWSVTHIQPATGGDNPICRGPLPKSRIRRSAEMIQVFEGYTPLLSNGGGWWTDAPANPGTGLRGTIYGAVYGTNTSYNVAANVFRHTQWRKDKIHGPNVLFADGHVEARVDILNMKEDSFSMRQ